MKDLKENKENNLCSKAGDLLAYLYEELPSADREIFELHLTDCGTCIDDFAEIAQGRYPVFEWKSLEFDVIPTPRIVIPAQPAAVGLFDRLRAAFAVNRGLTFGSAAAAVIVAMFAGYAFYFQNSPTPVVAVVEQMPPASQTQRVISTLPAPEIDLSAHNEVEEPKNIAPKSTTKRAVPLRASAPRPKRIESVRTVKVKEPITPPQQLRSIPVLSIVEEDEDESLRLADLFEDIGASE